MKQEHTIILRCNCGAGLSVLSETEGHKQALTIEPCANCVAKRYNDGYGDGIGIRGLK